MSEHIERIKAYITQRAYSRRRVQGDIIHGCHFHGDEGAELTLADLTVLMSDYETLKAQVAELEQDCRVMADSLRKTHEKLNCGNNRAIDFITHGKEIKLCPACAVARKYAK